MRYSNAQAAIKIAQANGCIDLAQNDYDFLIANKMWIATERSRVRRVLESTVYGALDLIGLPRFPAPVEFVAAAIVTHVHPCNYQYACHEMSGCEWIDLIIAGVEQPCSPQLLFSHVLKLAEGDSSLLVSAEGRVEHHYGAMKDGEA